MFYTLDRFEGEFAVLIDDNKEAVSVLKELLLQNNVIGNVFISEDKKVFSFCPEETEKRRNKAVSLHRSLFDNAKKNKK